ncbi:Mu transposase C-terminal domain-containing protein [Vibrio cholerae]|uniref:Mu transposase C-terminal domain-containing protein n=1 Tax=Vibrio cholerae TaxID=666 RepID=UPI000903BD3B|nr:Mu transposase C-terminal domain-containing protein [Vibrio cholerae]APF81546.1 transposase [Vibrio cholerae]EJB5293377.1 DDE-type integrase/transposase/recombinase [Vibrio cholerae]EJL6419408.1 DDE-type integrase/transposase/recombinase [Vibrio cholerae]EKF9102647.1 DDE-type integrase/transposase/recombinase [Vibrio cholerae]EKF9120970.1 DDE-type integrase/transposase/recombinase [Vibrio cholerae]
MNNSYESYNESFEPRRGKVNIEIDALVQRDGAIYRIVQILDFESVIAVDVETGRTVPLRIGELRNIQESISTHSHSETLQDLSDIADEDWQVAQKRYAAIRPLIGQLYIGREGAERRAKEVGINVATLYRWLKRFNAYGSVTALLPMKRGWKEGNQRISKEADDIIHQVIRDYYLTPQRPTVKKTVIEVFRRCNERGIQSPSHMTIRARITRVSEKDRLRARGFREKALNKFSPVPGSFPNADYPLAVVQIDHTPADIILVDDLYRKPIGRPWITLAVDVHTRMVVGYYLSFDPPSETSVGMCVANSILPKEEWLLLHNVDTQWPVWGIPNTIHVDNGADFRSNNFQRSCLAYGINLEFRPVRQPRYGGHIERLLGTLLREIHDLPGTTFSSIKDREGYDAEKHASMTKSEFETWLVTLICKVYHQRLHSSIGMSPMRKWEIGIFGNNQVQGIGLPPRPADRMTALLDFLPSFRRTVQTFGVTIDGMRYYAEALRPWIGSKDLETGKKLDLLFRRDPRDISSIWFFDPDIKQYFKIPFADQAIPPMSIWEYQQAREKLKREGIDSVNEHQVLRSITELRAQVDEAKEKSKKARRQAQRRKEHEKNLIQNKTLAAQKVAPSSSEKLNGLIEGDIEIFGDIA